MARQIHRIVDTAYGEVMVKPSEVTDCVLECWIGDNFDDFIGEIEGMMDEDDESFRISIENELF